MVWIATSIEDMVGSAPPGLAIDSLSSEDAFVRTRRSTGAKLNAARGRSALRRGVCSNMLAPVGRLVPLGWPYRDHCALILVM